MKERGASGRVAQRGASCRVACRSWRLRARPRSGGRKSSSAVGNAGGGSVVAFSIDSTGLGPRARRGFDLRSSTLSLAFLSVDVGLCRSASVIHRVLDRRSDPMHEAVHQKRGRCEGVSNRKDHRSVAHCSNVQVQHHKGSRRRREPKTKIRIPARVQSGLAGCTQPRKMALVPGPTRYRNNRSGLNGTPSRTT